MWALECRGEGGGGVLHSVVPVRYLFSLVTGHLSLQALALQELCATHCTAPYRYLAIELPLS